ncbi:sodium:solute symporter family transporter [Cardinium endosymbiont of Oedothorax gibbosus]|uniref:sodium:solute symporter family transporter n=1 Tax=Cardinium endosymbiont of Oedothorax gibbosus TaxID=931101 RepID=UPI0020255EF9|nr:hypothetical protein [Cardinium endosymbiont of Oedothorax gibbosus]
MLLYNAPLLIVLSFLVLSLAVGLYSGQKENTFREYAVGSKRFSTPILMATLLASNFGGEILITSIVLTYIKGLESIIWEFMGFFSFWMTSLIWLHITPFIKHFSVSETIGHVYGKYPRVITALFIFVWCIGGISLQISTMCIVMSMFIESVDYRIMVILATFIFITYAALGGIRSVTNTDVLQFITFVIIIAFFAKLCFEKTGKSVVEVVSFLKNQEKFQWSSLHCNTILHLVLQAPYWFLTIYDPLSIQKVYMASSPFQVKKVFYIALSFTFL